MRQVGYVACMGDRGGAYRDLVGNLKERGHLEDLSMDGRIILKWIFLKRWMGPGLGLGSSG
jgi:hypothetical protein